MKVTPFPGRRVRVHGLRTDRPLPPFDVLLLRAHIVAEGQARRESPHKAAALGLQSFQHLLCDPRLHEYIIVEIQHGVRGCAPQQEIALLGNPLGRHAAMPFDRVSPRLDNPHQGFHYWRVAGRLPALVGDDQMKAR